MVNMNTDHPVFFFFLFLIFCRGICFAENLMKFFLGSIQFLLALIYFLSFYFPARKFIDDTALLTNSNLIYCKAVWMLVMEFYLLSILSKEEFWMLHRRISGFQIIGYWACPGIGEHHTLKGMFGSLALDFCTLCLPGNFFACDWSWWRAK